MATPLAGLAVVVTRPVRQNDALLRSFREAGADAVAVPLLTIEPLGAPDECERIHRQLQALSDCNLAIIISQNAANELLAALHQRSIPWPANLPAYAVGNATAALLQAAGIACTSPARMDSEGLLALPTLQTVAGQRAIIFRGVGGRETLAQVLRGRGAAVDYCELYRRRLPDTAPSQWADWLSRQEHRPALVCINSRETLEHLLAVDPQAASRDNLTLLVPGERVASAATHAGFPGVVVAPDATDPSTLDTAIHWYTS